MNEFKVPASTAKPVSVPAPPENPEPVVAEETPENPAPIKTPAKREIPQDAKCPYIEPKWSSTPSPDVSYKFEVLKSGAIVEEVDDLQSQPFWVFGRLPNNDVVMAHPTISRYHAVLQYRPKATGSDNSTTDDSAKPEKAFGAGWYIYDLGSTHGTFLNKMRIPPKTYIPVRVGHIITLGNSTRKFILQGPDFDEEPESELTVTEIKERRVQAEEEKRKRAEIQEVLREKEGISWGMGEDADEETDLTVNPYATTNNEELFLDDPKKTLRGFFEREGLELDYKVDEMSPGTFVCRVELPIDDAIGKPIVAEICHKGKKKDCVLQCALEACRILDRQGVLRQAHHEPRKRRVQAADSDDDDDFLDRTGDVERKKLRKATLHQNNAFTYDDLLEQETELLKKISTIKDKILRFQECTKRSKEAANEDEDLDDFMKHLSNEKGIDKADIRKLRVEEQRLQVEHQKVQRLIKIATPIALPSIKNLNDDNNKKKSFYPLFGKRNKSKVQVPQHTTVKKPEIRENKSDEEEMEEDEPVDDVKVVPSKEIPVQKPIESIPDQPTTSTQPAPPLQGPTVIPPEIRAEESSSVPSIPQKSVDIEVNTSSSAQNEIESDDKIENDERNVEITDGNDSAAAKKRRNRNRNRTKGRENVDFDDKEELEDGEKYSKWIPPENQAGDGITSLNQKFGY